MEAALRLRARERPRLRNRYWWKCSEPQQSRNLGRRNSPAGCAHPDEGAIDEFYSEETEVWNAFGRQKRATVLTEAPALPRAGGIRQAAPYARAGCRDGRQSVCSP